MKKFLIACATVIISAFAGFAQDAVPDTLGFCSDLYTGIATGDLDHDTGLAIEIPGEMALEYTGKQISKVRVAIGDPCATKTLKVFIAEELGGVPVYEEEFNIDVVGGWNEYTLKSPYLITGAGFILGYTMREGSMDDWSMGIDFHEDGIAQTQNGNYILLYNQQSMQTEWVHFMELGQYYYYSNACIEGLLEDGVKPENNIAISNLSVPYMLKKGEEFELGATMTNAGVNEISSVELTLNMGGASLVKTVDIPTLAPDESKYLTIGDLTYEGGEGANIAFDVTVSKVNGVIDPYDFNNTASTLFWSGEKSFTRVVVAEENTGIWCGNCPRGAVAIEQLKEKYPDTFIGIGVHGGGVDPMQTSSYTDYIPASLGYPTIHVNRRHLNIIPAPPSLLDIYYNVEAQRPSFAEIKLSNVAFDSDFSTIDITAETEFAVDIENGNYRIAYVLLENQVGPYKQTNYFNKTDEEEMQEWVGKGETVRMLFDDVARGIYSYYGLKGSINSTVAKGEKCVHTYPITLDNVDNYANIELVALIVDYNTEEIINATKLGAKDFAGVEDAVVENSAPAVYYNLQGVQVSAENLVPGVYVKRQGDKTEKVLVK